MKISKGLIIIFILFLFSCTGSFEEKINEVDDIGRDTQIIFDIPIEQTSVARIMELSGTASDTGGVQKVQLKINTAAYSDAVGTARWKKVVEFSLGENIVYGRVINDKGEALRTNPFYIYCLWEELGELPEPLSHSSVVQNATDTYLLGGWVYNWDFIPAYDTFLKFRFSNKQSTIFTPALVTAAFLSQSVVYNNKIILLGGLKQSGGKYFAQNFVHVRGVDGSVVTLSQFDNTAMARGGAAYAKSGDKLYVFGGFDYDGYPTNTILSYDLTKVPLNVGIPEPQLSLGSLEGTLPRQLVFAGAVTAPDGKILVFGGLEEVGESRVFQNALFVFDPVTKQLTELSNKLLYKRAGMGVVLLGDKVYLLGGEGKDETTGDIVYLDRVEVFSTASYTSKELRRMPFALGYMGATANDGKIMVLGGRNDQGFLTKSEIYAYYPLQDDLNQ